ncbi:MAG: hypothetical protein U1C96_05135 [Gallionella sp.]|nr:hypothetical protein [Gallionella sp.]
MTQNSPTNTDERRANPHLRVAFTEACSITAPFFDPEQGWGGMSLTMYARQALREAYPDLTQQDIALLFSAVQRFHTTKSSQ